MLAIALPAIMLACNQKKVEQLTEENTELSSANQELNVQVEDYLQTFNEIEANLEEIKQRENLIEMTTSDDVNNSDKAKQGIVEDIRRINALMLENREKMQELQTKLSGTSSHFQKMVARLNERIKEQDSQILAMKEELEQMNSANQELTVNLQALNTTLDTLSRTNFEQGQLISEQKDIIDNQTAEMNKAYVAIGSLKQLKEEQVVLTEGGLFGLGKVEKLNEQASPEAFRQINIREVHEIPVEARKMELVTTHPEGSYTLSKNEAEVVEKLVITDPDRFWNTSRYLVVKVN
jgi:DNA repair exonuclease SbcCD ATPase subunit